MFIFPLLKHVFGKETLSPDATQPAPDPEADAATYREGISTLMRLQSNRCTTCKMPRNRATVTELFFLNAKHIVRIYEPQPNPETYDNEDLLIEANIFVRKGGRIQFLHGPQITKLGELLQRLSAEGFIQAQQKTLKPAQTTPEESRMGFSFTLMDETAARTTSGDSSVFCAQSDLGKSLATSFQTIWTKS